MPPPADEPAAAVGPGALHGAGTGAVQGVVAGVGDGVDIGAGAVAPAARLGIGRAGNHRPWVAAGLLLALLGAVALVRLDIAQRRAAFAADARTAHRLLSQQAAQLDTVLATLVLLAPGPGDAAQRLPALLPSVLQLLRRDAGQDWPATQGTAALAAAEDSSRALPAAQRHAVLGAMDVAQRQYTLVLAGDPSSYALRVDAHRLVPAEGWPLASGGPVRVVLVARPHPLVPGAHPLIPGQHQRVSGEDQLAPGQHQLVLQAGASAALQPAGLTSGFTFSKQLATPSQPFELQLQLATGPAQWPWRWLLAWAAACAAGTAAALAVLRARQAERRSAELMRMTQVARLNTLGELAAGMAHELNQPLAAVLASTQAAQRLLRSAELPGDDGPDLPSARQALNLAASQARRAAEVVTRLRRLVQDPTRGMQLQAVDLTELAAQMLQLLAPELQRRRIAARLQGSVPPVWADPVALEQIVHNLVSNAVQALEAAATPEPAITLVLQPDGNSQVRLLVRDNGPGIAPENLDRVFEPFFSTHSGGLGLGLPLCETLAQSMGGKLVLRAADDPAAGSFNSAADSADSDSVVGDPAGTSGRRRAGAEFQLTLSIAATAAAARAPSGPR